MELAADAASMAKDPPKTAYTVVPMKDGTYAVQDTSGRPAPLIISGFETKEAARAWIDANLDEDSGLEAP